MKLAVDESAGAVGGAGKLICELHTVREGAVRKIMPMQWSAACCQPIFDPSGNRGACPPGIARERERMACPCETVQGENNRRDCSRRRFCFRLPGIRIGMGSNEIANPRARGCLIAPMDRHEQ